MKSLKNSHHRGVPVADWMLVVAGNVAVAVDNVETTEKDVKKVMKTSTIEMELIEVQWLYKVSSESL